MKRLACLFALVSCSVVWAQSPKPPDKPAPTKGTEVTLGGMKAAAPAEWISVKPANRLRHFQFKLPKAASDKEDAEVFALDMHGKPADNLARLKELFVPPPDTPMEKAFQQSEFRVDKVKVTLLDVTGTYLVKTKPIDEAVKETRLDYRMIAVLWESPDGGYTIRMIGPKKTVERHAEPFVNWLKRFK